MLSLIGVILAFVIIFVLRAKNIDFSITLLAASVIIGLTSGKPFNLFLYSAIKTISDVTTFNLFSAVALITLLGYSVKKTGLIMDMIDGLKGLLPSQVLLLLIPALFGLLSMPGGALMSAPFNDPEANRLGLKPEHKTYINVWFRHIWYWASPISPVPILAASLAGLNLQDFLYVQLPFFAVTIAIGFIVTRQITKQTSERSPLQINYNNVSKGLAPIISTIILTILGIPIWAGLIVGILMVFILKQVSLKSSIQMVREGIRWDIAISVIAIFYLRYIIIAAGSVSDLFQIISNAGVSLTVLIITIPLIIGALSGTPTMGLGIVFPLLIPQFEISSIHLISIIYAGIIAGYLASPMHLCLILTNSYYKSKLRNVYRYILPSIAVLYSIIVLFHLIMNG